VSYINWFLSKSHIEQWEEKSTKVLGYPYKAQIHDTIRIQYGTDTSIRGNFKIQNTIRLRYFNKKNVNYILKLKIQNME
jgi:DNA polymerase III psi subunit